jgi:hypothetical protein
MKAPENEEYKEKLERVYLNRLSRCSSNMIYPPFSATPAQIVYQAIIDGFKILNLEAIYEAQQKLKSKPEPMAQKPEILETKLGSMSPNPFIRARVQILNKMDDFHRKEIEKMEKDGNTENRVYNTFAHDVRVLGDQLEKKQYGD